MPSPLEAIHEQHRQAQKHAHEKVQLEQKRRHDQHQSDLKNLHAAHQQEMKQMHQKHALHHDQVTEQYAAMPPQHINEVANLIGNSQAQEHNEMLGTHDEQVRQLHNAHFNEHMRDHTLRNQK